MGEKVGFTNCVFEKLCSSENTFFIVFSACTAVAEKGGMLKKQKCYETWWVVLEHGKKVFLFGFSSFNVIVVCFCVSGKNAKVLRMFFFWGGGFARWFILVYLGFGRFRCFCVSWFCLFLLRFCFFCCLLCFGFVVGFVLVLFLFVVFFLFFFCFFLFVLFLF